MTTFLTSMYPQQFNEKIQKNEPWLKLSAACKLIYHWFNTYVAQDISLGARLVISKVSWITRITSAQGS